VATVKWTSDQVLRRLLPQGHVPEYTDPSGKLVLAEMPIAESWIGRRLTELEASTSGRIAYVTRQGEGLLPDASTVYQHGDLVHFVLARDQLAAAERILDQAPPAH
jgi:trk system potassium uptake protein TrkA